MAVSANSWRTTGPFDLKGNALLHLERFGFRVVGRLIYPPRGYELNAEDKSAILYLVATHNYDLVVGQPNVASSGRSPKIPAS